MSLELLEQIVSSESEAEGISRAAAREAEELVKSAEEATRMEVLQAANDDREDALRLIEEARPAMEDEVKALEVRRSAEHAALYERAYDRIEAAAQMIFERIRADGHR